MSKNTRLIALMLVWMISSTGMPVARAADESTSAEEKLLQEKGLKQDDREFLLDEAPAIEKYEQAKSLYADYQRAVGRMATIVQYDEAVQAMQMEQQALQEQVNALQMQINSAGTGYGRMQRLVNMQLAPLRQQQAQARAMITQINAQIQASKGQAPKAEDRKTVPALVATTRKAYIDSVRELNDLVVPLLTKYHELALDKTVTDALERMRHRTTHNYRLGPSDKLVTASKLIPNLKKHTTESFNSTFKKKAKSKIAAPSPTP
jgi:hypothetical protein